MGRRHGLMWIYAISGIEESANHHRDDRITVTYASIAATYLNGAECMTSSTECVGRTYPSGGSRYVFVLTKFGIASELEHTAASMETNHFQERQKLISAFPKRILHYWNENSLT